MGNENNLRNPMMADNSNNTKGGGAQTPQYIIQCDKFFDSDIEGYEEDSAPCISVIVGSSRLATYNSSGELSGDGLIVIDDPIVTMIYGSWAPIIQQYMYEGKNLDKISIKRFINIHGTKIIIQELNYGVCLIKTYKQLGDTITFSFCAVKVEDVNIAYDQTDGSKIGNTATMIDTSTLKITTG